MLNRDGCFGVDSFLSIINKIIAILLDNTVLLGHHGLGLSCFASLDALVPRVLKFCVVSRPAFSKPRTANCAATEFAEILDGTTCEAKGTGDRCCGG